MTPLGPAEVVCLFGRRGTGKTTLARRLVEPWRRLVVWDPLGEWSRFRGVSPVEDLPGLLGQLKRHWLRGFRLAIPGDEPEHLDGLARLIWAAQAPFPRCPPMALVVDEANMGLPVQQLRRGLKGMSRLVLQGRHRGVAVLAISQRPALVSLNVRANAHRTIAFALPAPQDRRALAAQLGRAADQLGQLPDFHCLEETNGRVTGHRCTRGRAA